MIIKKGYTITVDSWENDGDYPSTKSINIDDEKKAKDIAKMCKRLFCSSNNDEGGIGNSFHDEDPESTILKYMKKNPNFFKDQSKMSDEDIIEKVMEINSKLLGFSNEGYYSRVVEDVKISYSPTDIKLKDIKF